MRYYLTYPYYWIKDIPIRNKIKQLRYEREVVCYHNDIFRAKKHVFKSSTIKLIDVIRYFIVPYSISREHLDIIGKYRFNSSGTYVRDRTIKHVIMFIDAKLWSLKNKLNLDYD